MLKRILVQSNTQMSKHSNAQSFIWTKYDYVCYRLEVKDVKHLSIGLMILLQVGALL
jgi:hypothetical protein